jgi:hypothetical protein
MRVTEAQIRNSGEDGPLLHPCRTHPERRTSCASFISYRQNAAIGH